MIKIAEILSRVLEAASKLAAFLAFWKWGRENKENEQLKDANKSLEKEAARERVGNVASYADAIKRLRRGRSKKK